MDEKKNVGLIATIVTALLCGCPGICLCFYGAAFSLFGGTYYSDLPGSYYTGDLPPSVGYALLCVGLIMVLIPIGVGGYTFFSQRKDKAEIVDVDEPVPPAI
jgi:hypothetical protein